MDPSDTLGHMYVHECVHGAVFLQITSTCLRVKNNVHIVDCLQMKGTFFFCD